MATSILLIDDDQDELFIFNEAIKETGLDYKCIQITNLAKAIDYLKNIVPAFIFVDFDVLHCEHFDAFLGMRKLDYLKDSPTVVFSNYINKEVASKAAELDAEKYIEKPLTITGLALDLKNILSISRKCIF